MPVPPAETDDQSLYDCLGRVQQAEKALFIALNEIVDTRESILQMVERQSAQKFGQTEALLSPRISPMEVEPVIADDRLPPPTTELPASSPSEPKDSADGKADKDISDLLLVAAPSYSPEAPEARFIPKDISKEEKQDEEALLQEVADDTAERLGLAKQDILDAYRLFCEHDHDQSGKLSVVELKNLLSELTHRMVDEVQTEAILQECDKNNDDELDFEEFLMCVCHTPEKKAAHLAAAVAHHSDKPDQLSRSFVLRMVGIPYSAITGFLQKEINEMTAFLSIPIIAFLFTAFALSSWLHQSNTILHASENAVRIDIEENANFGFSGVAPFENGREGFKNIHDVHTLEDFWSFMDLGLMPLFFPSGWGASESRSNVEAYCTSGLDAMKENGWSTAGFQGNEGGPSPFSLDPALCALEGMPEIFPESLKWLDPFSHDLKKPFLLFNEIIAGVRMEQEMLSATDCGRPEFSGKIFNTPCGEENAWAWLQPDMDNALGMREDLVNRPGGETVYFKSATTLEEVKANLRKLEDERWLNPMTSKVQILLTTYNNQMDMFTATYVNFLVHRGGGIYKVIKPVCFWLRPYRRPFAYVTDAIWLVLVLKLFIDEAWELVTTIKTEGMREGLQEYFYSIKNIIDWASISYSFVIFVLVLSWFWKLGNFRELLETADSNVSGSWPNKGDIYTASNLEYWQEVTKMVEYYRYMLIVCAFYPMVIGARFFSSFSSQPRLGLVTATLTAAAKDIFHFLVVLAVTLVIFCSSGEFLFGVEVDEYESFGRTFMSVFRAMLGDFDYLALSEVGRLPASVWWLLFVVLVNMVMLNMLLVIIMDVYVNIKSNLASDDEENFPTIWSQTYEILGRWRLQFSGKALSITRIFRKLDDQEDKFKRLVNAGSDHPRYEEKLVTLRMFLEAVDGLKKKQAEQLMTQALDWHELQHAQVNGLEDILGHLKSVDLKVQRVQESANSMQGTGTQIPSSGPELDQSRRDQLLEKARNYAQSNMPSLYLVDDKAEANKSAVVQQPGLGCCDLKPNTTI